MKPLPFCLTLLYLISNVKAYWLDSSCTRHQNAVQIEEQINAAFTLAGDLADSFIIWDNVNGMDANTTRLFNLLFGGVVSLTLT